MPNQNDADSVCYNLFAHYNVYRVTRDAVPARVPNHSTNTLIDEVGLIEMEVGLDQ